jgi:hypothetical protein
VKPDFQNYVAYRLATDNRSGNARGGCGPIALLIVLAAIVIVVFAIAR